MNVRHLHDERGDTPAAVARAAAAAVARRPSLWWAACSAAMRFAAHGWWRRPPFLPLPDTRYWRFRMETAYGDERASPDDADVTEVVRWSRRARAGRR